jgi:hypothetical protein
MFVCRDVTLCSTIITAEFLVSTMLVLLTAGN